MNLYSISHFIQIWLFPPGLILLLFLIGFILVTRQRTVGKILILSTFVIFWLFSTPIISQRLIDGLQKQYIPLSLNTIIPQEKDSAIIVLGSGVESAIEYADKHTVSDKTLSRLHYAAYLYNIAQVPIIVSGGNRVDSTGTEADLMHETLEQNHIPVMIIENKSRNTKDEAILLAPLLKNRGIRRVYLITHACHMPRSMISFKQSLNALGISVIPAPMGYITLQTDKRLSNYLPLLNALNATVLALHEYVGIVWYRSFYKV